jgi:hypothetical protein
MVIKVRCAMDYRTLMVSAVLATGVAGFAPSGWADMVAADNGIAVRDSGVTTPARGMTMSQVASKFGDPSTKIPAVGTPPISRWEYPGFVVYFERDHVIHSVVSSGAEAPGAAAPGAAAPGASSPAATTPPAAPTDSAPSEPSAN